MVKHILTYFGIICIIFTLAIPCFAYDNAQSESDWFGFSYDNSGIFMFQNTLDGNYVSVDNQTINTSTLYFYFPCSIPAKELEYHYSLMCLGGGLSFNSADYGEIYGGTYHILGSITGTRTNQIGVQQIEGSNAKVMSFFCRFGADPLPFDTFNSYRYIRLTVDCINNFTLVNWLNRSESNATYSLSATEGNTTGQVTSGALSCSGYYITGSLKSMYYNGSSTSTFNGNLLNGTTGTGGYLHVPAHNLTSNASSPLKFSVAGGNIVGTLTPDSANNIDRTYIKVVTVSGTRTYNDKEMIEAVQDASDRNHTDITNFSNRNHTDLVNIGNNLQKLVDHQNEVTQAGNDIGSTTSSSSISNTSGNLGSGVSGLNSTLSTASDVSSFVTSSTPYISFIGAFLPVVLNYGNGVLAWAVVAIIAVTVFLYILKKVSE